MKSILSVIFLFISALVSGQNGNSIKDAETKLVKQYKQAQQKWKAGENEKALKKFEEIVKKHPKLIEPYVQISGIYYEQQDLEKSECYLQKAIDLSPDFNPGNIYSLARLQHQQEKYQLAAKNYAIFIDKGNNKERINKAKHHLQNAQFASNAIKNPVPFAPILLDDEVNSEDSEYLPAITADEELMIFTRRLNNQEDFYQSKIENGSFQTATPIESINSPNNEGAHCITPDGKQIYFTFCHPRASMGACDIFVSKLENGNWSKPTNLGEPINSRSWDGQPSISADGKNLIFCSKRNGGFGGADLWISKQNKSGEWMEPLNLGERINSSGNEESPFLHPDGKTLYFRSDGLPGMGDFDIFFSKWDGIEKEWEAPVNIGYPINSQGSEGALFVNLDGSKAYFASDIESLKNPARSANLDLFTFPLYEEAKPEAVTYVRGSIKDKISKKGLKSKLIIIDYKDPEDEQIYHSNENGEFLICLPIGTTYSLTIEKEAYSFHSENFQLEEVHSAKEPFVLDIALTPIRKKVHENWPTIDTSSIILNNIFFETGSAILKKESDFEINHLFKLLQENKSLQIKIVGHTDNVGTSEDNQSLSEQRAEAVYQALLSKGISSEKLAFEGRGEKSPIADNFSPEGRQKNRRTEFVILAH